MIRARIVETLLAALATICVVLPATTLFTTTHWVQPAVLIVLLIGGMGALGRGLGLRGVLIVAAQTVVAVLALGLQHGQGHLTHGLPTWETAKAFGILLDNARETVMTYSAPAPTNRAIIVAFSVLIAVLAIAVDYLGATRRAPAAAGLALLTAYILVAANSGDGLPIAWFLPPAITWLALVGRDGVWSIRRWSTSVTRSATDGAALDPAPAFASVGRFLALGALVAAVVLTAVVPHFPTTFLAAGLGHTENGRGGSGGVFRLNSTLDLNRSLGDRSGHRVLTYTTNAPSTEPLRVDILGDYENGLWTQGRTDEMGLRPSLPEIEAGQDIARSTYRITVEDNQIRPPQIALPGNPTKLSLEPGKWGSDRNGTVRLQDPAVEYTVDYADLQPTERQLLQGSEQVLTPDASAIAGIAPDLAERLNALARELVPEGSTPLAAARAIQSYFRSSQFTYSLDVADTASNLGPGRDGLSRFLETKRGYCVQFATGMIMLSRTLGIPARMAVGFLPGVLEDGRYQVRAADAHAWPELYFSGVGWIRFEPTPSTRSGTAPSYTLAPTQNSSTTGPTPTPTATSAPAPSERPETDPGTTNASTRSAGSRFDPLGWLGENWQLLAVLFAGLLGTLLLPVGAWVRRTQARRRAQDEAGRVEADWAALLSRLGDIGVVPPDGATPRQSGEFVRKDAFLDSEAAQAMSRVVTGVETARYAGPQHPVEPVEADARTVWKAASGVRRRRDRLRAVLLPADGRRFWTEAREATIRAPRAALEKLRERQSR